MGFASASKLHRAGMPRLELFLFRHQNPVTGKWMRARYLATREEIEKGKTNGRSSVHLRVVTRIFVSGISLRFLSGRACSNGRPPQINSDRDGDATRRCRVRRNCWAKSGASGTE